MDDDLVEPGSDAGRIAEVALVAKRPLDRGLHHVLALPLATGRIVAA